MPYFRVKADRQTGAWLDGTMLYIGDTPAAVHDKRQDTSRTHYDTFERDGVTCAVKVVWGVSP